MIFNQVVRQLPALSRITFFDQLLHQGIVDAQVWVHLLQASVLPFQILESLQIRSLHATVSGPPLVEPVVCNDPLVNIDTEKDILFAEFLLSPCKLKSFS